MNLDSRPDLHPQVAARVVDGSAVIVLADSGQVNVLNEVGTRIWQLIDGTHTLRQIADRITEEYDVPPDQASDDVKEFIQQLLAANAVTISDARSGTGALS